MFAVSVTTLLLADYYGRAHIQALGGNYRKIIEKQPEAEGTILEALKEYKQEPPSPQSENLILAYGYSPSDFWESAEKHSIFFLPLVCWSG
ncbi:MAG: hypothetical protein NC243_12935 [Lachnoclostridium sp.]|nr:hypothetical protein [Lachnoclostridium sp.]